MIGKEVAKGVGYFAAGAALVTGYKWLFGESPEGETQEEEDEEDDDGDEDGDSEEEDPERSSPEEESSGLRAFRDELAIARRRFSKDDLKSFDQALSLLEAFLKTVTEDEAQKISEGMLLMLSAANAHVGKSSRLPQSLAGVLFDSGSDKFEAAMNAVQTPNLLAFKCGKEGAEAFVDALLRSTFETRA